MPWSNNRPRSAHYRYAHTVARRAAAQRHHPNDPCTRCGHPLGPMGRWLHYDHNGARTAYLGFAHGSPCPYCGQRCNQVAGAKAGRARQAVTRLSW